MAATSPRTAAVAVLLLSSGLSAGAEPRYAPGVTDTEIKLGQTAPYSGPASAFGTIGRAQQAYFAKINAERGINGRRVTLISLDDGFNPAKTVEQTRKLVEAEQVLAMFSSLGPGTLAVRKYVDQRKVPYLFIGDGGREWDEHTAELWTMAFIPAFESEGRAFARYIERNHPKAKVAVLAENGPLGRDGLATVRAGRQGRGVVRGRGGRLARDHRADARFSARHAQGFRSRCAGEPVQPA